MLKISSISCQYAASLINSGKLHRPKDLSQEITDGSKVKLRAIISHLLFVDLKNKQKKDLNNWRTTTPCLLASFTSILVQLLCKTRGERRSISLFHLRLLRRCLGVGGGIAFRAEMYFASPPHPSLLSLSSLLKQDLHSFRY